MKAKEIKQMTKEELENSLDGLFRERLNLRVQAKTGQLQNSARILHIRRDIARIRTELRSRALAGK
jgi:large subunit ribosomal protein L29